MVGFFNVNSFFLWNKYIFFIFMQIILNISLVICEFIVLLCNMCQCYALFTKCAVKNANLFYIISLFQMSSLEGIIVKKNVVFFLIS